MADLLTMLEVKLDELYTARLDYISRANFVVSWEDYNYRAGYLEAIRNVGVIIKDIRSPQPVPDRSEISNDLGEFNG